MMSEEKCVGRNVDEREGVMNESPPPPVSPSRSFWTAVKFGKEFGGRTLVDLSLDLKL